MSGLGWPVIVQPTPYTERTALGSRTTTMTQKAQKADLCRCLPWQVHLPVSHKAWLSTIYSVNNICNWNKSKNNIYSSGKKTSIQMCYSVCWIETILIAFLGCKDKLFLVLSIYIYILHLGHLADAFIQSDLQRVHLLKERQQYINVVKSCFRTFEHLRDE